MKNVTHSTLSHEFYQDTFNDGLQSINDGLQSISHFLLWRLSLGTEVSLRDAVENGAI